MKQKFYVILLLVVVVGGFYFASTILHPPEKPPFSIAASEDAVWFTNPHDGQSLYRMEPDGSHPVKILDGPILRVFADRSDIFLIRASDDQAAVPELVPASTESDPAKTTLCRLDAAGRSALPVLRPGTVNLLTIAGGQLYYTIPGTDDGVWRADLNGQNARRISGRMMRKAVVADGQMYYILDRADAQFQSSRKDQLLRADLQADSTLAAPFKYSLLTPVFTVQAGVLYCLADQRLLAVEADGQTYRILRDLRPINAIAGNSRYLYYSNSSGRLFLFSLAPDGQEKLLLP